MNQRLFLLLTEQQMQRICSLSSGSGCEEKKECKQLITLLCVSLVQLIRDGELLSRLQGLLNLFSREKRFVAFSEQIKLVSRDRMRDSCSYWFRRRHLWINTQIKSLWSLTSCVMSAETWLTWWSDVSSLWVFDQLNNQLTNYLFINRWPWDQWNCPGWWRWPRHKTTFESTRCPDPFGILYSLDSEEMQLYLPWCTKRREIEHCNKRTFGHCSHSTQVHSQGSLWRKSHRIRFFKDWQSFSGLRTRQEGKKWRQVMHEWEEEPWQSNRTRW